MKNIQTEILINVNVSKVWSVLMDFEKHSQWNPFIKSMSGEKKAGTKLSISIYPPGANKMAFKPTVLIIEPNREFRWRGKLGINGIFDGEHYFILESIDETKTKFTHGENFSGLLVPFVGAMLDKTKNGFQLMNEAIKKECEKNN